MIERVRVDTLQEMQDRFAALSRTSLCICDVKGRPITRPSWGSRFSELVSGSPKGRAAFERNLRRLAKDPTTRVPSICHKGATLFAAPIVHQDHPVGIMILGARPRIRPDRRAARALAERYVVDETELTEAAARLDPCTDQLRDAIQVFACSLAQTIATLYGQADRIHRQLADLRTVHELAEALAGAGVLQDALDLTARRVVDVMGVKACGIRLLNEETGELVITAVCNLSQEYLNKGAVMLGGNQIDQLAFLGQTIYIPDVTSDPRTRYPASARKEGLVSGLCVPMAHRGKTVGVLRVYAGRRHEFGEEEVALARSLASQAASAVLNNRLREERAATERFRHQVAYAGEIQRRMLPKSPPAHPVLSFGAAYSPTRDVGGDGYDFLVSQSGEVGLWIADVVGKGLPAALMLASLRSMLRAEAKRGGAACDVMGRVNRHMSSDTLIGEFATVVYGAFSPDGRQFTYSNAGHEPPLLLRGDRFRRLSCGGMVIGVDAGAVYQSQAVTLEKGDVLVFATDGVIEAMDFHGESYGRRRMRTSVKRHRALEPREVAQQLLWDVRRFAGLAEQSDDITIVAVKVG